MSKIQNTCETITHHIGKELNLEENQKAVIQYGLFAIIHTTLAIGLSIILGALFGVLMPTLIISIVAVILRKYSGGAHASNPEECAVIGTIVAVGGGVILNQFKWHIESVIIFGIIIFCLAFYWIYKLAPVDSKAKPIKKLEKRAMLKKKSYFVLTFYGVMVVAILAIYLLEPNEKLLVYTTCIYGGISWQVFTLTALGHQIIQKIDRLFNKSTKNEGGI